MDLIRLSLDHVTDAVRVGAACIIQMSAGAGRNAEVTSGFRPATYQAHLREVWDKWQLLKDNSDASCRDTKAQVEAEWDRHQLVRQPVQNSNHPSGNAVDIKNVPATRADAIAVSCKMYRPEPVNDRVHYQPR